MSSGSASDMSIKGVKGSSIVGGPYGSKGCGNRAITFEEQVAAERGSGLFGGKSGKGGTNDGGSGVGNIFGRSSTPGHPAPTPTATPNAMRVFTPGGIFDESSMPVDSSADADSGADLFPLYNRIQSAKAAAAAAADAAARPGPYGFSLFSPAHVAAATSAAAGSDKGKGKDKSTGNGNIFGRLSVPKPPMGPPPAVVAAQAAAPRSGDIDDVGKGPTRYGQMCKKQQEHGEQLEMQQCTIDQQAQKLNRQEGVLLLQRERIEEQAGVIDQHEHRLGQQEQKMRWLLGKLDRMLILPSDGEQP